MLLGSCAAVLVVSLLIPKTYGLPQSPHIDGPHRLGFTLGDDVTLTCPVMLSPGEEYKKVWWTFYSEGRYTFNIGSMRMFRWEMGKIEGDLTGTVPVNGAGRTTLTLKNAMCHMSGFYDCLVVGTKGTDTTSRLDVYLFKNSSAKAKLTPDPIVAEDGDGQMEFTCVDEAFVPGSFIRMYSFYPSFRGLYTEVATNCTVEYLPGKCSEVATCRGSFSRASLIMGGSVHCEIMRPDGRNVQTNMAIKIKKSTIA